jgi:hypothetical protein
MTYEMEILIKSIAGLESVKRKNEFDPLKVKEYVNSIWLNVFGSFQKPDIKIESEFINEGDSVIIVNDTFSIFVNEVSLPSVYMEDDFIVFDKTFNDLLKATRRENRPLLSKVNRYILNLTVPYSGSYDEPPGAEEYDVACSMGIEDIIRYMVKMQADDVMNNIFEGIFMAESLEEDKQYEKGI